MPQFFLNKRLIVLLVGIIILVALIGFSLKEDRNLSWQEKFIQDSIGLVQKVFHQPAQYIAGFFENLNHLKNTYEENELLRKQLNNYIQLEEKLQELEQENRQLKEELKLSADNDIRKYKSIQGTVIARNPDRWHDYIKIDKGEQHGIKKDMAVITAKGLIGKVKNTSEFTSTVQLLSASDRKNRISAMVHTNNGKVFGLIVGYSEQENALEMNIIESNAQIKENQIVATSGLGGVFPEGLVIGKVKKVELDSYGLTKIAYITPSADFYDIDRVMIIERVLPTVDINQLEEEEDS
ncbi:rod shape-determining protein MreC [Aeribacillus pallidus]|uniref:rod shape-determining protein MreC n=1 Tax=Aeribacillus TaxID=1055323 RepID=UPI0007B48137|nr:MULTISPECIES: rod shape-determining protein MreC [Aeribacillus]KZM54886.1 rod shape-determining protein MreC [Aeribacillus pallidus]MED0652186.1 rod shape-determining protein MreC [Aeribacillus composti]MED4488443.1 rod shape-determining protein MreC [Aeribacillus pallidus]